MEPFEYLRKFWFCFVALFVAVDAIGTLPILMNLTGGMTEKQRKKLIGESIITALVAGVVFLFIGNAVLNLLGISIADFMIAGGIILFLLSLGELLNLNAKEKTVYEDVGAVPLGVPLIVGPAVLAASMLLLKEYGGIVTGIALGSNILIAGLIFWFSGYISRILGKNGEKVLSKLASLLLAAYGVMMVRKGIMQFLSP